MSSGYSNINVDEYKHYNYEEVNSNQSRKHRSEAALHSNDHDPYGHTRNIVEKLANSEKDKRETKK